MRVHLLIYKTGEKSQSKLSKGVVFFVYSFCLFSNNKSCLTIKKLYTVKNFMWKRKLSWCCDIENTFTFILCFVQACTNFIRINMRNCVKPECIPGNFSFLPIGLGRYIPIPEYVDIGSSICIGKCYAVIPMFYLLNFLYCFFVSVLPNTRIDIWIVNKIVM